MEAADFYLVLNNTDLLSDRTVSSLKHLVEQYPYFNVARMLYLKNLAMQKDIRLESELKNMAVYISDRRKLFTLLEGDRYNLAGSLEEEDKAEKSDAFSLIDAFLSSHEGENNPKGESALLFQPSVSSDYIYWSLTKESKEEKDKPEIKLQHHDLIDSFIKSEEERIPGSGLNIDMQETGDAPSYVHEEQPKSLGDSYFTETLAHIYVKQKRYEKALQIIKNLNLKYPEKNIYFADQIKFLEKLIINTKK